MGWGESSSLALKMFELTTIRCIF